MSVKAKYESLDRSKLSKDVTKILDLMKKKTSNFENKEIVKSSNVEKALDRLIAKFPDAVKKKEEKKSKSKAKSKTKSKAKSKAKKKTKTKSTAKSKSKPFMTRVKEYAENNNLKFSEARKELSKKLKDEKKKEEKKLKSELDELLNQARSPIANKEIKYKPRKKETESKAGKVKSASSDASRKAKPIGKRVSKNGKVYYEYRENRSDTNSVPTKKGYKYKGDAPPYLEKGGALDDAPYDVMAFKTKARYNSDNASESLTTKTYKEAVDKALDFIDEGFFKVTIFSKTGYLFEVDENGVESFEKGGEIDGFTMQMVRGTGKFTELETEDANIKMAKGGRVINVVNEGMDFDKERYEAIFGDYDDDGVTNINDVSPLDDSVRGRVEQVKLNETFSKLIDVKNELDGKMYDALKKLDKKAPKNAELYARTKTPYSIVKKLVDKRLMHPTKGLTDMIGTTIAVDNQKDLEKVKKDIQGGSMGKVLDFDDFYKNPNNGYRAYHFIVEYEGTPVEVQLKTKMQKKLNEVSHEFYKDDTLNAKGLDEVSKMIMKADKGDKKALTEVKKLMADKAKLKHKLSTGKMAKGGQIEVNSKNIRSLDKYNNVTVLDNGQAFATINGANKNIFKDDVLRVKNNKVTSIIKPSFVASKMAIGGTVDDDSLMMDAKGTRKMSFADGGSLSTITELVGTTGAMTEIDLFEKGGTLEIPSNIKKAVRSSESFIDLATKLDELGIKFNLSSHDMPMPPMMISINHNGKKIAIIPSKYTDDADFVENDIAVGYMAKGGQTKKRPKSALMRDRKYYNKNESWERQYSKGKNRKGYKKKGGEVSKTKRKNPMVLAKEIRKDGESWTDAVSRASKIMREKK